jgi:hypothetical protein
MEPIRNALAQAGNLVQQAAYSVVEVLRGGDSQETHKDQVCDLDTCWTERYVSLLF